MTTERRPGRATEELSKKWEPLIGFPLRVRSVQTVNHKPDIFCIGPKHIHEAQKYGGILGQPVLDRVPCAHCKQPHSAHSYDTVMFLDLLREVTSEEVRLCLLPHLAAIEADGIQGFAFMAGPHKIEQTKREEMLA